MIGRDKKLENKEVDECLFIVFCGILGMIVAAIRAYNLIISDR